MNSITSKFPLIIEDYSSDYTGYKFLSLIYYDDDKFLSIIDNVVDNFIISYVLDFCNLYTINTNELIVITDTWNETNSKNYPISLEFARLGKSIQYSKLIRKFSLDYTTRVIGPINTYQMKGPIKKRRRKRKSI